MKSDRIWLTWERQRRNGSLSKAVSAPLFELLSDKGRVRRYLELSWRTIQLLVKHRPNTVFAQNPSIVLALLVVLFRKVLGYKAVIDQHNAGLFPMEGRSRVLNSVARFIIRHADISIVTNNNLAKEVKSNGGTPVVLPDPLPFDDYCEPCPASHSPDGALQLLFICTWAPDEPYLEVIQAAEELAPFGIRILITGNPKNKIVNVPIPENVTLLGFVPESEYISLLAACDAVIVLTTREDCLNCGAYEAVALGKPGVLSNTNALRAYFRHGFIFAGADAVEIRDAILELAKRYLKLVQDVTVLKQEIKICYPTLVANLNGKLSTI